MRESVKRRPYAFIGAAGANRTGDLPAIGRFRKKSGISYEKNRNQRKQKTPHDRARRTVIFVVVTAVRSFFVGSYENIFTCVLTLILFCVPLFIDRRLRIDLPPALEGIIYCFIYSAEILGEINSYYTLIPGWDTMLHTINGFLMAAIGFALVDIFNRSEKFSVKLSPLFLAIVAFCFSMTVGVLWEFFEFGMDTFSTPICKRISL